MKKQIFKTVGILTLVLILTSWGSTGHRKISYDASLSFNEEMSQFESWTSILADHASDADDRKSWDPNESEKHYIDIDNYSEFNSNGEIPQDINDAISAHGSYFVYGNGILPWATITAYDSLKSCFERLDWDKAVLFASDLGHYVADGHMPLHITRNYDGQYTNNSGIHSRYESTMINSFISQINYTGDNIEVISDVSQYVFDYIYSNYQYVESVLAADNYAKTFSTDTYSSAYKNALWSYSKDFTIALFKNASHALTELIYTAWVEAGSPSMTPTGINSPLAASTVILRQNFPNPFSNSTTIEFRLKENSKVLLQVTDISGKVVSTLLNEPKTKGDYSVDFNSGNLSSGTYYIILNTDNQHISKKMLLIR